MNKNFELINATMVHPKIRSIASKKAMRNQKKKALWVALFGNTFYIKGRTWLYKVTYPEIKFHPGQGGGVWLTNGFPTYYRKLKK